MKTVSRTRIYIAPLLFAAGVLFPPIAESQGLYNRSNVFVIGAQLHVAGDVINEGRLENSGIIAVARDWESPGTYRGNGTLNANGNTPQRISHHNQTVETFVVDGWGTKYIRGSLRVNAALDLKQGIVEVSSDDLLKLNDKAVASGGSSDSYVDGALTVGGNGYKYFPVGKNGTFAPIQFLDVSGDRTEFSIEAFENATATIDNVIVRNGVYWQRRDISGTFRASHVAIDYDRDNFNNPENIVLLVANTAGGHIDAILDVEHSTETNKISTTIAVSAPVIMLGETTEAWNAADFYLSTALSPHAANSDNRKVKIFGERLASQQFRFRVFDRWGGVVYENHSLEEMTNNGWDGRAANGAALSGGTYPYKLTAVDKTGRKFDKAGVITIIY